MKKQIKKVLAAAMAVLMVGGLFAGCQNKTTSDLEYVKQKGELKIGITYFAPMNYEENGQLTGFETEFATAVCEKLGVKPNFTVIKWDSKLPEIQGKSIDCIWNGMTITDELKQNLSISTPYMENRQVLVTKASNKDKFKTAEDFNGIKIAAEKKSAGETVAKENEMFKGAELVSVDTQSKALLEVKAGTVDAALVDYVLSIGSIGEGTDYADLTVTDFTFNPEQYGIAFRKDSDITPEVNKAISELAKDGTLKKIAEKYKLDDLIIAE